MHSSLTAVTAILLSLLIFGNIRRANRRDISPFVSLSRPSQVVLGYMFLFHLVGSVFFHYELVLDRRLPISAETWSGATVVVYLATGLIAVGLTQKSGLVVARLDDSPPSSVAIVWGSLGLCCAAVSVATGSGVPVLFATTFFLAGAGSRGAKTLPYIGTLLASIALLVPLAAQSKRVLIFPLLIGLFLMWRSDRIKTSSVVAAVVAVLGSILPLSILRGYGGYEVSGFSEAVRRIPDYVRSDIFLPALANNVEASSFYFHGINALDKYLWQEQPVFGESILNAVFLGSSAIGFDDGLRSSIQIYTERFYPEFRGIGGSYPVALESELAMNFGVSVILLFPLFLLALDLLWVLLLRNRRGVAAFATEGVLMYATFLLVRGSSMDLFVYNLVLMSLPIPLAIVPIGRRIEKPWSALGRGTAIEETRTLSALQDGNT